MSAPVDPRPVASASPRAQGLITKPAKSAPSALPMVPRLVGKDAAAG